MTSQLPGSKRISHFYATVTNVQVTIYHLPKAPLTGRSALNDCIEFASVLLRGHFKGKEQVKSGFRFVSAQV